MLTSKAAIPVVLWFQIVPLVVFPLSSFRGTSQEWWLPALLSCLTILAVVQILFRHNQAAWPWYLCSFSQGFNIISRLMLVLPHATRIVDRNQVFNTPYFVITAASMLVSAFALWYCDLPEIRTRVLT